MLTREARKHTEDTGKDVDRMNRMNKNFAFSDLTSEKAKESVPLSAGKIC
jgi:hypothetical protein